MNFLIIFHVSFIVHVFYTKVQYYTAGRSEAWRRPLLSISSQYLVTSTFSQLFTVINLQRNNTCRGKHRVQSLVYSFRSSARSVHTCKSFCLLGSPSLAKLPILVISVADPDPNPDPYVFGPPGSGSISQRQGSGHPSIIKQK